MQPIHGPPPTTRPTTRPTAPRRSPGAAGTTTFVLAEPAASAPETQAGGVSEPALSAMLALQEGAGPGGPEAVRDRQARRRGSELIEALAALQRAVLGGGADPALLQRLAGLVAEPGQAADPGLQQVVAAIRLRACVELARYGAG